jgi:PAS domain S-box-containing protein
MLPEFLLMFFSEGSFIPHGDDYLWQAGLVWLTIVSDSLIAIVYYVIPLALLYFVKKRRDLLDSGLFLLFSGFIISCGTAHIMDVWTLWHPTYWLSGFLQALTTFVSVYTAIAMMPVILQALELPSPSQLKAANHKLEAQIVERQRIEEKLRESDRTFRAIFNNTYQFTGLLTPDGILLEVNQAALDFAELQIDEVIGRPFWETPWWRISPQTQERLKEAIAQVANKGEFVRYEVDLRGAGDSVATIDFSLKPVKDESDRVVLLIPEGRDITQRKQAEKALCELNAELAERVNQRTAELEAANQLLSGQKQVLEMLATGASLPDVLDALIRTIEQQSPQMLCSILLLDADRKHLRHGAAPSLPDSYNACIDGIAIGPEVGCCGTVIDFDRPAIVSDITLEPLSVNLRDLALSHGLHACWCQPMLSTQGNVLGTFAIYYREPRRPSLKDLELIETAARIAGIAIEQKQVDKERSRLEERFRATFEQAAVGIAHAAVEGRFLRLNQKFCDLVGYTHEELLSLTFQDITYPDDLYADLEYMRQLLAGEIETFLMDKRYIRKDSSPIWVKLTVSLVRDSSGEPNYVIAAIQDITNLKEIQQALHQANEGLELRVQERTAALRNANQQLQWEMTERKEAEQQLKQANAELARSNQELEQFAYVASHDLREPLRKIKSYTDLLAKRYQGQLDEKADKYIAYITDGALRMQTLITDLLTYSRVGREEIALAPTDLNAVLNRTLTDLSTAIQESKALITTDALPTVRANSCQMGQLLQNLIANAIKFSGKQPPQIQIRAVEHDQSWTISVQDNGIGIEPQYADRIFIIFQRLHTRDEYPGTGIGLAICKKIVERHGGEIWVESEPGRGTTFSFTLPAMKAME